MEGLGDGGVGVGGLFELVCKRAPFAFSAVAATLFFPLQTAKKKERERGYLSTKEGQEVEGKSDPPHPTTTTKPRNGGTREETA